MLLMRCVVCAWPHRDEMQCALVLSCLGEQSTGGNLDFVYGTDKVGMPRWTETAKSDLAFDKWDWHRPADELTNTHSSAKLADRLLRGEGMSGCTGLVTGECHKAPDLHAPGWGYDDCCWVAIANAPNLGSLEQWRGETIEYWTTFLHPQCLDMLEPAYWVTGAGSLQWSFAAFTDALPTDTSCEGSHAGMHV